MHPSSNIRRDSGNSDSKNSNGTSDDHQPPPPPYRSIIDKLDDYNNLPSHPPSYTDINNPAVIYINNYPGPPLTDGIVQIITSNPNSVQPGISMENFLPKNIRIYLAISGGITIFYGLIAIGLQIGLIASHSIVYYYYGFWAGALIILLGISILMVNNRYRTYDLTKYFRSFICQVIFVAVVFSFGVIIISTDTCDEDTSDNDRSDDACKHSYKILNGLLITVIALTFLQSIINTLIIGYLKRRYSINANRIS